MQLTSHFLSTLDQIKKYIALDEKRFFFRFIAILTFSLFSIPFSTESHAAQEYPAQVTVDRENKTITVNVAVNLVSNDASLLAQYKDELLNTWNELYSPTDENGDTLYPMYLCYKVIFNLDVTTERKNSIQRSELESPPYSDNNRHDIVIIDQSQQTQEVEILYDRSVRYYIRPVYDALLSEMLAHPNLPANTAIIPDMVIMRNLIRDCSFYTRFDYDTYCKDTLLNLAQRWSNYSNKPLNYAIGYTETLTNGINSAGVQTDESYAVVAYHENNLSRSINVAIHEIAHMMGFNHEENVLPTTSNNVEAITLSPAYFYTLFQTMGLECEWTYRISDLRYYSPTTFNGRSCILERLGGEFFHWDETAEFTMTFRAGSELITDSRYMLSAFVVSGTAQLDIQNLDYSETSSSPLEYTTIIQDGSYQIMGFILSDPTQRPSVSHSMTSHLSFFPTQSATEEVIIRDLGDGTVCESGITDNNMEYALFNGLNTDPTSMVPIDIFYETYFTDQDLTPLGNMAIQFEQRQEETDNIQLTSGIYLSEQYNRSTLTSNFLLTLYYPGSILGWACEGGALGHYSSNVNFGDWEGWDAESGLTNHLPTVSEMNLGTPTTTPRPDASILDINGFELVSLEAL